jgi:hypothetical protein
LERKSHPLGFSARPVFRIALCERDSWYLERLQKVTGLGKLFKNSKSGLCWEVKTKSEVNEVLTLIAPYVRFKTTRKKIDLVLQFIDLMPGHKPLRRDVWLAELSIISQLRKMSKRKLNRRRYNIDQLIDRFRPVGSASEAMVQEPPRPEVILKVDADQLTMRHPPTN